MIWDTSRFDQAPTKLYGTGKRGYKMDLLGDSYHAILEIGAQVRLHWNDGESWVRMEQTNWETSCAPDLADQFQLKCTAEEEDDNGQLKLALDTEVLPVSFHPNASLSREGSYYDPRPAPCDGLLGTLELPRMDNIPLPPTCSSEAPMPERQRKLFDLYMKYAIRLEGGFHVDQVISNHETDKTHLQLMEDLMVLKVDQSSGRVIEFPMRGVSKVYRMVKYGNRWRAPNGPAPVSQKMRELAQERSSSSIHEEEACVRLPVGRGVAVLQHVLWPPREAGPAEAQARGRELPVRAHRG
eukprot:CAMPEP_0179309658 /NCGR_PEP_ID=MMETSP0797-20121207/51764_1 /TAXON_ID=47934 /ORGANISM="Dinophysis acuminata, Strain DAEP01" /LENGTH=296 /DNA_ID=CAMNT_0021019367 /DNA_START=210 /DNA_END=1097 /DNA_ORIENTATION=+